MMRACLITLIKCLDGHKSTMLTVLGRIFQSLKFVFCSNLVNCPTRWNIDHLSQIAERQGTEMYVVQGLYSLQPGNEHIKQEGRLCQQHCIGKIGRRFTKISCAAQYVAKQEAAFSDRKTLFRMGEPGKCLGHGEQESRREECSAFQFRGKSIFFKFSIYSYVT